PREERLANGARRSLQRQAPQQPESPRVPFRRRSVFYRSAVRIAESVRRRAQGASVQRRLLPERREAGARLDGSRRTERDCVLARRALPVRDELGREAEGSHALRGPPEWV